MKKQIFIVLVALALASLACNFSGLGGGNLPEGVLFQDDFSGRGGGWDSYTGDPEGLTDYADGEYRIKVDLDNTDFWSNPQTDDFADVVIEVDARRAGGPQENIFGVQCRYQQSGSGDNRTYKFYFLAIGSDGYATIGKVDTSTAVEGDAYTYFDYSENNAAIKPNEVNRIEARCVGSTLTLSVNGVQLLSVNDTSLTSGGVGLLSGTYDEPGVDIYFDNFVVRKP